MLHVPKSTFNTVVYEGCKNKNAEEAYLVNEQDAEGDSEIRFCPGNYSHDEQSRLACDEDP